MDEMDPFGMFAPAKKSKLPSLYDIGREPGQNASYTVGLYECYADKVLEALDKGTKYEAWNLKEPPFVEALRYCREVANAHQHTFGRDNLRALLANYLWLRFKMDVYSVGLRGINAEREYVLG